MPVTFRISKSVGYTGKGGRNSYIAQIYGTDKKYIFARTFVATEATDPTEMFRARRKGRGSWQEAAALDVGFYEICRCGEKSFVVVYRKKNNDGDAWTNISDDRAIEMAVLMHDGSTAEEARLATRAPKPDADAPADAPAQSNP